MDGTLFEAQIRSYKARVSACPVLMNEVPMKDDSMTQQQNQAVDRNDPAIDPQTPGDNSASQQQTSEPDSADSAVDQKNQHDDNDNEFSPGFKPEPDRAKPGDDTDGDIDTDGG